MLDRLKSEISAELIETAPFSSLRELALKQYLGQVSGFGRSLVPPAIFIGDGDYLEIAKALFRLFVELCGLKRSDRVLDVGSGQGRLAIPLTRYLRRGSYDGIEIVAAGVEWCRQNFTTKYPNFQFHHADIFNKEYNPAGKSPASEYHFPFADNSFDFVFLTSVFTHLLPRDMENYFSEISRVMKPGGRSFITYFLLNRESLSLMGSQPVLSFKYEMKGYRTIDTATPEVAIAYDQDYVTNLYKRYGFEIAEPIHFGNWSGRQEFLPLQDIIVAVKK
jgi:SAM-dependent methyltransferase